MCPKKLAGQSQWAHRDKARRLSGKRIVRPHERDSVKRSGGPGPALLRRATALEQKVIASNFEIIYGSGEGAALGIVEEYDNLLLEGTSSSSGTVLQGVFQLIQSLVKTRRENQTSAPDSAREKSFLLAGTPARWCAWDHFQHAFLCQAYALMDATATDASHDLCWGWPVLGVPDPEGRSFDSVGRAGASSTRGAQRRIGSASGSKFASGWSSADWKPGSQDRDRVSSRSRGQSSHGSSQTYQRKGKERAAKTATRRECGPSATLVCILWQRSQSRGWHLWVALLSEWRRRLSFILSVSLLVGSRDAVHDSGLDVVSHDWYALWLQ